MLFGDRLRMLREEKGLTQKELGEIVKVSERVIGYYEANNRFPKDENTLKRMADYFNVSVDFLIGRTDIRNHADNTSSKVNQEMKVMDEDKLTLINDYDKLTPEQQKLVRALINSYKPVNKNINGEEVTFFVDPTKENGLTEEDYTERYYLEKERLRRLNAKNKNE